VFPDRRFHALYKKNWFFFKCFTILFEIPSVSAKTVQWADPDWLFKYSLLVDWFEFWRFFLEMFGNGKSIWWWIPLPKRISWWVEVTSSYRVSQLKLNSGQSLFFRGNHKERQNSNQSTRSEYLNNQSGSAHCTVLA
jgi:hypothetical protein